MYSSTNAKTLDIVFGLLLIAAVLGHTSLLTGDLKQVAAIASYLLVVALVSVVIASHRERDYPKSGGDHAAV